MPTPKFKSPSQSQIIDMLPHLKECLDYNPDTGEFTWRERPRSHFRRDNSWKHFNRKYAGNKAGKNVKDFWAMQYVTVVVTLFGTTYAIGAHNLAWAMSGREFEEGKVVDHKNRVKTDNRLDNLRLSTQSENNVNTPPRSHSKSGIKGVRFRSGRWHARMVVNKKEYYLGAFDTPEEAVAARIEAQKQHYGEFVTPLEVQMGNYRPPKPTVELSAEDERWLNSSGQI